MNHGREAADDDERQVGLEKVFKQRSAASQQGPRENTRFVPGATDFMNPVYRRGLFRGKAGLERTQRYRRFRLPQVVGCTVTRSHPTPSAPMSPPSWAFATQGEFLSRV